MSKTVKGNHPLAELLAKKLFGIEIVGKDEQVEMVRRAIKAAVIWNESYIDTLLPELIEGHPIVASSSIKSGRESDAYIEGNNDCLDHIQKERAK